MFCDKCALKSDHCLIIFVVLSTFSEWWVIYRRMLPSCQSAWIQYLQSKCLITLFVYWQTCSVWPKIPEKDVLLIIWPFEIMKRCFCNNLCKGVWYMARFWYQRSCTGASVGRDLDSPVPDTDTASWLQTQHRTQLSPSARMVAWKHI